MDATEETRQPSPPDTPPPEPARGPGSRLLRFVREVVEIVVLAAVVFFVVQLVVQNFEIEGPSMEPTLNRGDRVLVNRLAYLHLDFGTLPLVPAGAAVDLGGPGRGDIVVLHSSWSGGRDLIKRVVALPGETIEVRDGEVLVDGVALVEPYLGSRSNYTVAPRQVGADHYFVLGDNRRNSSDSHVWGDLPRDAIVGAALVRYWPPGTLHFFPVQAY